MSAGRPTAGAPRHNPHFSGDSVPTMALKSRKEECVDTCVEVKADTLAYPVPVEATVTSGSSETATGSPIAGAIALTTQVRPHEHDEILLWESSPRTGGTQWTRMKELKGRRTQELIRSNWTVATKWPVAEVPWFCHNCVCDKSPCELSELSHAIVTLLRHHEIQRNVDVDGTGMAYNTQVSAHFSIGIELIIHIARFAEMPRLQVRNAVLRSSITPFHESGDLASAQVEQRPSSHQAASFDCNSFLALQKSSRFDSTSGAVTPFSPRAVIPTLPAFALGLIGVSSFSKVTLLCEGLCPHVEQQSSSSIQVVSLNCSPLLCGGLGPHVGQQPLLLAGAAAPTASAQVLYDEPARRTLPVG